MKNIFLALTIPVVLSGCAGAIMELSGVSEDMAVAATGGNYAQILSATEARYGSIDKMPENILSGYCESAFLAKRYDKLQTCFSQSEKRRNKIADSKLLENPALHQNL